MSTSIAALANAAPGAGPLAACTAFLWVSGSAPNPGSVVADFVKPTWAGYADVTALAWVSSPTGTGGTEAISTTLVQWVVGAAPDAQVLGWGLLKGALLIGAEQFLSPLVPQVGEVLAITPAIAFPNP